MIRIILSGCSGKMGQVITSLCTDDNEVTIAAGIDKYPKEAAYPVYPIPSSVREDADCLIDFSSPEALSDILKFGEERNIPLILATTGYTEQQNQHILNTAKKIPIFRTANMSLGINVMLELVKKAAELLGDSYDIEIVEKHHNLKKDAPSGTALMIADAANSARSAEMNYIYARNNVYGPRQKDEIGISSVRGGTIVGEHEIIFAGTDEILEIKHTAYSKKIFATGALKAAKFIVKQSKPGIYSMKDLMEE